MENPTSFGSVTSFDQLDLDEDKVLVWSHTLNDWITVPLRAFYELLGTGVGSLLLYASTAAIYANNSGLYASSLYYVA